MKRNGTTSNGTTRWRCKICGASLTKQRSDITNAALFRAFIQHLTAGTSLAGDRRQHELLDTYAAAQIRCLLAG